MRALPGRSAEPRLGRLPPALIHAPTVSGCETRRPRERRSSVHRPPDESSNRPPEARTALSYALLIDVGLTGNPGDVAVIPGGVEHEDYFPEDSEAIDFFAPVREDFLTGAPPSYMTGTQRAPQQA